MPPGAIPRGQPRAGQPGPARRDSGGLENYRGRRETQEPQASREPRGLGRWGSLPGGFGVGIIAAGAVLGAIATVLTRTAPGLLLGAGVVGGTVIAALAVRPRAGRVIFPVPVLFYLIAALTAGIIYDRSATSSNTALAIDAAQWVANGFFAMALATVLAIVLVGIRWYVSRRDHRLAAADSAEFGGPGVRGDMRDPGGWWGNPRPPVPQRPQQGQRPRRPQGPDQYPGTRPQQRPGWPPDQRPGRRPGSGPYNFSSGA